MHGRWGVIFLVSATFFFTGCTQRILDFTVVSTKNIDWSRSGEFKRNPQRVEGSDLKHIIIVIPTGVPSLEEAIDNAIEKVPGGVALVDGVLSYRWWYIPYVYGQVEYVVKGSVLVDPQLAGKPGSGADCFVVQVGKSGTIEKLDINDFESWQKDCLKLLQGTE